jgi:RNA polymerase sigma-70 factor (ECF subfamily)
MGAPVSIERTTKDLIALARAGDSEGKEALVERYREELDHYIRLRAGGHLRGRVEIEDVFQETLARAFGSIDGFRWQGEGSYLRWLKGIAENVILALAKKYRREEVLVVEDPGAPLADTSPSLAARRDERFDRLQKALDLLEPDYREVIVLARLKGLRLKEVGKRMDRSPNAVAHLLSRALTRLKEAFGDTESFSLPPRRLDGAPPGGQSDEA